MNRQYHVRALTTVLSLVALFVANVTPVTAATFTVTSAGDNGSGGGTCGGSCTLRDAIIAANDSSGPDTIVLGSATYTLAIGGASEDAAATGDLDITDDVTIVGAGRTSTIIDGQNIDRIFHLRSPNGRTAVTAAISDLTIINGAVSDGNGGGILNDTLVTLTLTNVNIESNTANNSSVTTGFGLGGGVYNAGTISFTNCNITSNTANVNQDGRGSIGGGGIHNAFGGSATLDSTVVNKNSVTNARGTFATGGGIQNLGTMVIQNNSRIGGTASTEQNQAHSGGGISNIGGELTISDTVISYNTTTVAADPNDDTSGQAGGGIFAQNAGTNRGALIVTKSTISHNYSDRQGGGVFNSGAPFTLTYSTIESNTARYTGAGITNLSTIPAEITNSTIYGNRGADNAGVAVASSKGGGLYTSSRISVSSATIYNNDAGFGDQIYLEDNSSTTGSGATQTPQVKITSTIVASGSLNADETNETPQNCGGTNTSTVREYLESSGFNIDSGATCLVTDTTGTNIDFSDKVSTDPLFEAAGLADNSGPTKTVALQSSSPALEHRELSGCPALDQRGYRRQNLCDTGAYEYDASQSSTSNYDLKMQIAEGADPATVDHELVYTMTVTNLGPDSASGVRASLALPISGFNASDIFTELIDGATGSCSTSLNNTITCDLGTLARFARAKFSVTLTPNVTGTFSVTASVTSTPSTGETFTRNNSVSESTEITVDSSVVYPASGGGGIWPAGILLPLLASWTWRRRRTGATEDARRPIIRRG